MKLSNASKTDLTNTDVQSTKLTLILNPLLFLNTFSHSNHSHTDMKLIPLEKIHSSRDSVRKARESHLIDKAMTLEPTGLNRHDKLLLFFLFQFLLCVVRHFHLSLLNNI